MTYPYGVDPSHRSADLLVALLAERHGDLRDLEKERFTPVVATRPKPRRRLPPITRLDAARHGLDLVKALDDYKAGNRGTAA